jgi:two-component system chemotaxis response regulator CheY
MNLATQNKNLFVLDDDAMFHRIITLANRKNFFRISHHYQVRSILAYLWNHKDDHASLPDVIFADLIIPHYDGWCFLNGYQKIRNCLCKDIAVYVVSASISKVDIEKVANYSFVKQYITKPISMDKFREIAGLEKYQISA